MDTTTPPPPHANLASILEGWAPHYLEEEALGYVQEALVDVAAWAAMNSEATQYPDHLLPPCHITMLDCSQPKPLTVTLEAEELCHPATTTSSAPAAPPPTPTLVGEVLAMSDLAAEVPRPRVEG